MSKYDKQGIRSYGVFASTLIEKDLTLVDTSVLLPYEALLVLFITTVSILILIYLLTLL